MTISNSKACLCVEEKIFAFQIQEHCFVSSSIQLFDLTDRDVQSSNQRISIFFCNNAKWRGNIFSNDWTRSGSMAEIFNIH